MDLISATCKPFIKIVPDSCQFLFNLSERYFHRACVSCRQTKIQMPCKVITLFWSFSCFCYNFGFDVSETASGARNKSNFGFCVVGQFYRVSKRTKRRRIDSARIKSVSAPKNHIKSAAVTLFGTFRPFLLRVCHILFAVRLSLARRHLVLPHKNSTKGKRNFTLTAPT